MLTGLLLAAAVVASPPPDPLAGQPWAVALPAAIERRTLTFTHDGARLTGTLYAPAGGARVPALIAFHGAGAPSQDHPLYDHLKTMLPPLGMAVFVFDRRGTGGSTGDDARKTDFDLLAADGVAARAMLARDPRIDPARIGYWGLSQGGWLTLLAAARDPQAAFAISVSAPMTGADIQMNFAVANVMRIKGYPQTDIDAALAARDAVDRYVRGQLDRATAERAEAAAKAAPWWRDSYLAGNLDDPTWRGQMDADPLRALRGSRVPTLMMFGQGDPWIPVGRSLAALKGSGIARAGLTVRVVAGADHAMMLGVDPKGQIDPKGFDRLAPDAPEYLGRLAGWLTAQGLARPQD